MRYFHRYGKSFDWLFPKRLWRVHDADQKSLFLTFDDGPVPDITTKILDILRQYDIRACFFCVGENIDNNREVFDRIIAEGHSVGNHTYHHLDESHHKEGFYLKNIALCSKAIGDISSTQGRVLFRPPYGRLSRLVEKAMRKTKVVMWSILSGDFDPNLSKEVCLQKTIENTNGRDIIVFHDNIKMKDKVLWVLPLYIEDCLSKGVRFERLE